MTLTIVDKILLAAYALEEKSKAPFTAEALIVEAWMSDNGAFGLQGYADKYPDANRILTKIMGTKGLRGKGWIEKVGEKQYQLTTAGRNAARNLVSDKRPTISRAGGIEREELPIIQRLLKSPAFKKTEEGRDSELIFRDACNFWGISSYSNASTLRARFAEIRNLLQELYHSVASSETGEVVLPHMKIAIDKKKMTALQATHKLLQEKFFDELEVIRKRVDERKGLG
jgi:hypothetical protein